MYCLIREQPTDESLIISYFVAADMRKKELTLCKDKQNAYHFKNLVDCEITCQEINQWLGEHKLKVIPYEERF